MKKLSIIVATCAAALAFLPASAQTTTGATKKSPQKVEAQKDKSDNLITPLKDDGRLAGFIRTVADSVQTAAVNKVTNMVSLGLVSAKPKYMTGGLASNEKFKVKKKID